MSSKDITRKVLRHKKQEAISMLQEIAEKIETGQFEVLDQGFWQGDTTNKWLFRLVLKEADIPVLSETLREY